jgi:signal transduction histidine kinase
VIDRLRRRLSVSILLAVSLTLTILFYYNTWALNRSFEREQRRHKEEHATALTDAIRHATPGTDLMAIAEGLAARDPDRRYVVTDDTGSIVFDSSKTESKVGMDVTRFTESGNLGFASAPYQHPYRNQRWRFFVFWDRELLLSAWMRQAHVNLGLSLLACGVVLLAVINRITGRAAMRYEQLIRDVEELEEHRMKAQKLEVLSKMAAGVAHEIRNPLNSIGIGIQRLQMEFSPAEKEREPEFVELTSLLVEEVERLNRIIEEFLRFARPPRLTLSTFDLGELVTEMVSMYKEDAQARGVRLEMEAPADDCPIEADRDQIKQAVLNVMLNGIQAVEELVRGGHGPPGGGHVRLEVVGPSGSATTGAAAPGAPAPAFGVPPDAPPPVAGAPRDGRYRVLVSDNGPGIRPENRDQIFDIYFTTKQTGSGLGLSIVQRIVENGHGGRVNVDSAPGRTTFEIELPARAVEVEVD